MAASHFTLCNRFVGDESAETGGQCMSGLCRFCPVRLGDAGYLRGGVSWKSRIPTLSRKVSIDITMTSPVNCTLTPPNSPTLWGNDDDIILCFQEKWIHILDVPGALKTPLLIEQGIDKRVDIIRIVDDILREYTPLTFEQRQQLLQQYRDILFDWDTEEKIVDWGILAEHARRNGACVSGTCLVRCLSGRWVWIEVPPS